MLLSSVKFLVEDFSKFCGLLRITELYVPELSQLNLVNGTYKIKESRTLQRKYTLYVNGL